MGVFPCDVDPTTTTTTSIPAATTDVPGTRNSSEGTVGSSVVTGKSAGSALSPQGSIN